MSTVQRTQCCTYYKFSIVFSEDVHTGFCEPHLRYTDLPNSVIWDYLSAQCLCDDLVPETDADDLNFGVRSCKIAYVLCKGLYPRQRRVRGGR